MSGWERIAHLDRRWVFLGIALVVIIPIVTRLTVPLGKIAPPTRMLYDYIEAIEPGEPVMIAFDYGPSSMPELHPQAWAIVRHCMSRGLPVITVSLSPRLMICTTAGTADSTEPTWPAAGSTWEMAGKLRAAAHPAMTGSSCDWGIRGK